MSLARLNLALIGFLLLGYVFLDKGFAYIGVSSIYIGEIVIAVTIFIALITSMNWRCILSPIGYTLLLFLFWSICQLLFNSSGSLMTALRDSVIWGYALYTIFVASLLVRSGSIDLSLNWYVRFLPWLALWAAPAFILQTALFDLIPTFPGSDVKILELKAGDTAVHLAGALTFMLLGLHRVYDRLSGRWSSLKETLVYCGMLVGLIAVGSRNRGGLMSAIAALGLVTAFRPNARVVKLLFPIAIVTFFLVAFDVSIPTGGGREISVNQIVDNVQSVFFPTDETMLSGTVDWRLEWWNAIINDTLYGSNFWFGNGFGRSLADLFGVDDGTTNRSPHNGHLTILAREGVPGFMLWVIFILTVYVVLTRSYLQSLARKQLYAAKLDLWAMAYLTAFLANASFDVYLEGPQGGIWFWCVVGFAMALTHNQRLMTATARPRVPPAGMPRDWVASERRL
jgi:O-antigen ligase